MRAKKQQVTVSAKTKKFVSKLVREIKQDPILFQVAKRTHPPNTKHLKKRAEIMEQGLAQLGILEHCVMLTETKVAILTEYLDAAPTPTTKRRKKK